MKLIPNAKPIRIRIVSGGEEHSSIETLRNNYSLSDIIPLVYDGRLYKWLQRVGETKAAESAYILIGSNTYANSRDMVDLTASIFNYPAKNFDDLLKFWQKKYPKTYLNYLKSYGIMCQNISESRRLFNSYNEAMTSEQWRKIFISTLKNMSLSSVLDDFKKFKSERPMTAKDWFKVLEHHADRVSDKDLYLIAQAAYDVPLLKDDAIRWYQKSAQSHPKAKEWVNKNLKHLDPKEEELFDTFERDPMKFTELFFNSSYPSNLVRFLSTISSIYRNHRQPYSEQMIGRGDYSRYLFIVDKLYYLCHKKEKGMCVRGLKQLPNNMNSAYYFKGYKTLDLIIESIEKDTKIFGEQLSKLSYQQALLFIVGLAKIELKNAK